jgi:pilus assembly protein CpaB
MVTARSLNKRSTTILIAVVLAAGTGLLLFNYLSTVAHTAQAVPMRNVVVATQAISARTVVRSDMVAIAERPEDSVDPDVSTSLGSVVGQMAFIDIPNGSTLSTSKIGHLETGGLTMRVPAGQRAMSIALDPVKGVADLVQAGDHVDVIAVTQPRGNSEAPRVVTILRNKLILAMGSTMEVPAASAGSASAAAANASGSGAETAIQTATLAVNPREASTLALADLNATLRLALRSPRDSNHAEAGDDFVLSTPPEVRVAGAAAPVAAAAAPVRVSVQHRAPAGIPMIDGDQVIR